MGQKILARGWTIEINSNTGSALASATWQEIGEISSFTIDTSKNDADTTTFQDDGFMTHVVASRGSTISLEGLYFEDQTTGARDPGQLLVDQLGIEIGQSSTEYFRITSPFGTSKIIKASANVSGIGGGNDDPTAWTAELTVSGRFDLASIAVTSVAVTPTTLTMAAGDISDRLAVNVQPSNATDTSVTYSTSNSSAAVVTAEGRVVAIATGSATITVTSVSNSGATATVSVTVS